MSIRVKLVTEYNFVTKKEDNAYKIYNDEQSYSINVPGFPNNLDKNEIAGQIFNELKYQDATT